MREVCVAQQPYLLMTDCMEAQQRLLERFSRNRSVFDAVLVYQLCDVRVRNETIVMRSAVSPNAEESQQM